MIVSLRINKVQTLFMTLIVWSFVTVELQSKRDQAELLSRRMPEDTHDRTPNRMPEDMAGRLPDQEDVPDRMPEDLPDRMSRWVSLEVK